VTSACRASTRSLKLHRVIAREGMFHLINADDMTASVVTAEVAAFLQRVSGDSDHELTESDEAMLRGLGLLSGAADAGASRARPAAATIRHVSLFLTQQCNLDCTYCYGHAGTYGSAGRMSREIALRTIDWLLEQSGASKDVYITFFGGEPLLAFRLLTEVVAYAEEACRKRGKKLELDITTNGTLLDDEIIEFLKAHCFKVTVSFDGPKAIQDAQRPTASGGGSHDDVVPRLRRLLVAIPQARCRATLMPGSDPVAVEASIRAIGFRRVTMSRASSSLFGNFDDGPAGSRAALEHIRRDADELADAIIRRDLPAVGRKRWSHVFSSLLKFGTQDKRIHFCGAGKGYVGVGASGGVFLCHRFVGRADQKLGQVGDANLDRDSYQGSQVERAPKCAGCFAKHFCGGGCYHENVGASGSVLVPDDEKCELIRSSVAQAAVVRCRIGDEGLDFLRREKILPEKPCPLDLF